MLVNSLERVVPDLMAQNETTGDKTLLLHLERYQYAGNHLVTGSVADVACGVGYGSYMLATQFTEKISHILAADIDEASIEYARQHYQHAKIDFAVADAAAFQSPVPLNNIVSLETIEHLPRPQQFVQQLSKQLAPKGRFIASAPITPSMDANPYHLHDFTATTFKNMFIEAGLKEIHSFVQVQSYQPFSLLGKKEERSKDLRKNILGYYRQHPDKLLLRIKSLFRDGFTNKYLVAVFEKEA
jgi:2-polyprenyl-3-methyl-5-hydroxy-6-metoxy-1,4-benzoquinol methylase